MRRLFTVESLIVIAAVAFSVTCQLVSVVDVSRRAECSDGKCPYCDVQVDADQVCPSCRTSWRGR